MEGTQVTAAQLELLNKLQEQERAKEAEMEALKARDANRVAQLESIKSDPVRSQLYTEHGLKDELDAKPEILDNPAWLAEKIATANARVKAKLEAAEQNQKPETPPVDNEPARQQGGVPSGTLEEYLTPAKETVESMMKKNPSVSAGAAAFAKAFSRNFDN